MDIALVGAPGSGKSELAVELRKALGLGKYEIIDEYVENLAAAADILVGKYATYVGNFMIAGERLRQEVTCIRTAQPYIVCGSLVETITYQALSGSRRPSPDEAKRTQAFLATLGCLLGDMHAPVTLHLPGGDEELIADEISTALDILGVPCARLPEDSDERLDQAIAVIEEASTALEQAKEAKQRGVRPGDGDGREERNPSESVPDVPESS